MSSAEDFEIELDPGFAAYAGGILKGEGDARHYAWLNYKDTHPPSGHLTYLSELLVTQGTPTDDRTLSDINRTLLARH